MSSCFICTSFFFWTTLIPNINVIMQSISNRAVVYDFSVDRVDSVIFLRLFCGNLDGFRADGSHFVIRCGYMECLLKFIRQAAWREEARCGNGNVQPIERGAEVWCKAQ